MKPRAGDGSAADAAAAARAWAENLGGGTGVQGRPSRQTCWAVWREDLAVFEVLQPRGDSLRSMVRIALLQRYYLHSRFLPTRWLLESTNSRSTTVLQ